GVGQNAKTPGFPGGLTFSCFRRPLLYPVELQALWSILSAKYRQGAARCQLSGPLRALPAAWRFAPAGNALRQRSYVCASFALRMHGNNRTANDARLR